MVTSHIGEFSNLIHFLKANIHNYDLSAGPLDVNCDYFINQILKDYPNLGSSVAAKIIEFYGLKVRILTKKQKVIVRTNVGRVYNTLRETVKFDPFPTRKNRLDGSGTQKWYKELCYCNQSVEQYLTATFPQIKLTFNLGLSRPKLFNKEEQVAHISLSSNCSKIIESQIEVDARFAKTIKSVVSTIGASSFLSNTKKNHTVQFTLRRYKTENMSQALLEERYLSRLSVAEGACRLVVDQLGECEWQLERNNAQISTMMERLREEQMCDAERVWLTSQMATLHSQIDQLQGVVSAGRREIDQREAEFSAQDKVLDAMDDKIDHLINRLRALKASSSQRVCLSATQMIGQARLKISAKAFGGFCEYINECSDHNDCVTSSPLTPLIGSHSAPVKKSSLSDGGTAGDCCPSSLESKYSSHLEAVERACEQTTRRLAVRQIQLEDACVQIDSLRAQLGDSPDGGEDCPPSMAQQLTALRETVLDLQNTIESLQFEKTARCSELSELSNTLSLGEMVRSVLAVQVAHMEIARIASENIPTVSRPASERPEVMIEVRVKRKAAVSSVRCERIRTRSCSGGDMTHRMCTRSSGGR